MESKSRMESNTSHTERSVFNEILEYVWSKRGLDEVILVKTADIMENISLFYMPESVPSDTVDRYWRYMLRLYATHGWWIYYNDIDPTGEKRDFVEMIMNCEMKSRLKGHVSRCQKRDLLVEERHGNTCCALTENWPMTHRVNEDRWRCFMSAYYKLTFLSKNEM